jgi:cytochrome c biogenesis protein CcdA/DsbC/DsbD-like thiol-disulfide interchange protein/thiol-disulfide isomerase/thioredoxin
MEYKEPVMSIVKTSSYLVALLLMALASGAAAQQAPTVTAEGFAATDVALPGAETTVAFRFGLTGGWHVNAHEPYDEFLTPTVLTLSPPEGITVSAMAYPEAHDFEAEFQEEPLAVYEDGFVIGARLQLAEDLAPGEYTVPGVLAYQACNDVSCAFPTEAETAITLTVVATGAPQAAQHAAIFDAITWDGAAASTAVAAPEGPAESDAGDTAMGWQAHTGAFDLVGRDFGFLGVDAFIAFIDKAETAGSVAAAPEGSESAYEGQQATGRAGFLEGQSMLWVVLIILGGGLMLNLTPCVLPLIPINIAIIGAGARASSQARGVALGGAYGLGIALVYGLLGLVVVLGLSTAFGAINSSPWFNLGIAVLFLLLGLAMFDVITIDFSRYQAKIGVRKNENGSFYLAFFMGAVSALLAGACVAPVVIYTIIYAQNLYNAGNTFALLLPFLLGVGMALPWPFAGGGLSFLPKPGMWMVRVKQAFGVFIIGFAAYYGYHAYEGFRLAAIDPAQVAESAEESGWETSLEAGLARAAEEGKPVLIDFWATWCKSCLAMNNSTFKDESVLERIEDYVLIKYQAEQLSDPVVKPVLEHFDVLGLPTYIVLQPKG